MQRALGGERRGERIAGVFERRAESVAQNLEHVPAVGADRVLQQRIVTRERILHRLRDAAG